jgi:hypothetical protein
VSESDGEVVMRELVRLLYGEYVGEKAQSEKRLQRWAEALLQSNRRERDAAEYKGRYCVEPKLPPDILGIHIYLPKG